MGHLENATKLEEPFLVAGIADTATNEDRPQRGFGEESSDNIGGKLGYGKGIAIHFAKLARAGEVHLFPDKRRERKDFVEITAARKEILVAKQFVDTVGTQLIGTAEEKGRWRTYVLEVEGGAPAC